jgi:predicted nucleic acid-binding protein
MRLSSNIIISDTSCLILLIKINELELLHRFSSRIIITSVIKNELDIELPGWIEIIDPKDTHYQDILEMDLDGGEASAISLMLEIDEAILLIDDLKGRKIADKLKLRYSGTFGLLLKSKEIGLIKEIRPIIDKIRLTNFRFSEQLLAEVLKQANEK